MATLPRLSVVIHTKDAAQTLPTALESVEFADEIVIIDMHSQDDTLAIAKKFTDQIHSVKDKGFADPVRNWGLAKAHGDWILVLDADEEVPATLQKKILEILAAHSQDKKGATAVVGYWLARQNVVWGKWIAHTGWWPDYQLRLFKAGTVQWPGGVHQLPVAMSTTEYLPAEPELALLHHNYQSVSQFLQRLDRYTTLQAEEKVSADGKASGAGQLIAIFFSEWQRRFFAQEGYQDGWRGAGLALLQACYELVVALKVNELLGAEPADTSPPALTKALTTITKDLNYWIANLGLQTRTGPLRLWWQLRRKLKR